MTNAEILGAIIARTSYQGDHWIWLQSSPQINIRGKRYRPARVFWNLHVGPLADSDKLINTCGVKNCINPAHQRVLSRERIVRPSAMDRVRVLARKCGFELVHKRRGVYAVQRVADNTTYAAL